MLNDKQAQVANLADLQATNRLPLQLNRLRQLSPDLFHCVDFTRIAERRNTVDEHLNETQPSQFDFEDEHLGGRGESYRSAQRNPMVRARGIQQLFALASPRNDLANLSTCMRILDVLGGDGTLARALAQMLPPASMPAILTSDIAESMINAALSYGLPALQQPAQALVLKENCFDATLIAYGSHHIPRDQRLPTCQEAYRILKPGGKCIFHDFEEASPVARWFEEVVDAYSMTGHAFQHFRQTEMRNYLLGAGFTPISIQYLYDPFIVSAAAAQQAMDVLGEYLFNMYGLTKLLDGEKGQQVPQSIVRTVYELACQYFQYDYRSMGLDAFFGQSGVQVFQRASRWYAEMPRVALVGIAIKPGEA